VKIPNCMMCRLVCRWLVPVQCVCIELTGTT
jgi:hypothetical protein